MFYVYLWINGVGIVEIECLFFGVYIVIVIDDNGCKVIVKVEVMEDIVFFQVQLEMSQFVSCLEGVDG